MNHLLPLRIGASTGLGLNFPLGRFAVALGVNPTLWVAINGLAEIMFELSLVVTALQDWGKGWHDWHSANHVGPGPAEQIVSPIFFPSIHQTPLL
jgi:hypothetical protein